MEINTIKKQHIDNYYKAIINNIHNNTKALVEEDLISLIKKPPLDSMDIIKNKLLYLAKKNKIVLNTDEVSKLLDNYRKELMKSKKEISECREDALIKRVDKKELEKDTTFTFHKKDFLVINKEIKTILKRCLKEAVEKIILKEYDNIFKIDTPNNIKDKYFLELKKFFEKTYPKQVLENVDIKILVKDTTLINSIKEEKEHFIFTMNNSHLFE